jgi:ABC-type enterochelin transport system permease subunit
MKMLYFIAVLLAIVCLFLATLNFYDFLYRDDLPWKEGDLKAVMLLCVGGAAVFSFIALFLRSALKPN